jgi:hypothetical protein
LAHLVIDSSVHELQQLNGELDIPKTARPQLDLIVDVFNRNMGGDPLAHPLHLFDKPWSL